MGKTKPATLLDITPKLKWSQRFIIVGDIHGCLDRFNYLLEKMKFDTNNDIVICVGDLVDRGENSYGVFRKFYDNPETFFTVQGNHDNRFARYLKGNNVSHGDGLDTTIRSFNKGLYENPDVGIDKILNFFDNLPHVIKVHNGYIVHAGFNPKRLPEEQIVSDCIYMRFYGGEDFFDDVNGQYWFTLLPDDYPTTFSGHEVHSSISVYRRLSNNDFLMDGGCVFGGVLRGYDSKTNEIVSI